MNKKLAGLLLEALCDDNCVDTPSMNTSMNASEYATQMPGWFGKPVLIRTVTTYFTGEVVNVVDGMIYLEDAAWVANTGRFNECLTTGKLNEVEPYPDGVWVNRDVVVDISLWNHPLPRIVK